MLEKISVRAKESLVLPFYMLVVIWMIQLLQSVLGLELGWLGIYPREIFGLRGVILAPLLHGSWGHLLANTPPLFVMSAIILFFYRRVAIPSFIMIYLLTGLAVWLFGRPVFHIGASGVIYGLVSFLFWNGVFRKNIKSIAIALIVMFYYGSMFMGILPGQQGISWESHLIGGIVGIFASFWFKDTIEKDEEKQRYSWEEEPQEKKFYFDRDLFQTPKAEKQQRNDDYWYSNRS